MGKHHKWRKLLRKTVFGDELKGEWDKHSAGNLVMCLGDINGHIGRRNDGFDRVNGWYGVGQMSSKGRMLFQFCLEKELCVTTTWFRGEGERKVIFRMGENETEIDLVLIKREH